MRKRYRVADLLSLKLPLKACEFQRLFGLIFEFACGQRGSRFYSFESVKMWKICVDVHSKFDVSVCHSAVGPFSAHSSSQFVYGITLHVRKYYQHVHACFQRNAFAKANNKIVLATRFSVLFKLELVVLLPIIKRTYIFNKYSLPRWSAVQSNNNI